MEIRNRVKELRMVSASDLIPNSKNWRRHPRGQQDALRGMISEIGFADALIARETPDGLQLIDGHLRQEIVAANPGASDEIPVLVLDVTEEEADKLLATLDPLAAMAEADKDALQSLLQGIETDNGVVEQLLLDIAQRTEILIDSIEYPELPMGDKQPFKQMTFTLHDEQHDIVERALALSKAMAPFVNTGNENSNGNALTRICEMFDGKYGG